jgi:hypothetical protein
MTKAELLRKPDAATTITLDYPKERECVISPEYTFRIEAKAASRVEISIDDNVWQPCRQADGYWWYDWSGYMSGKHQAIAKIQPQNDGQKSISRTCHFRVELPMTH